MNVARTLFLAAALAAAPAALAQVAVSDAWVRGTVAGQKATGAFMKLEAAKASRLVSASSPVAGVVEIHEMAMENNVMKMRAIPGLALPAGKTVELKPGGYHVMLMDLKQPLKAGETIALTLVFEAEDKSKSNVELKVPVRALAAPAKAEHGKH